MSSFNINGPSSNQPIIQGSQNLGKDGGGGGNTGYMNMRRRNKKKNENQEDNSVFLEAESEDSFVKSDKKKQDKKGGKFLGAISKFIKNKPDEPPVKDSFEKQDSAEADEEDYETEEEYGEDYSAYNIPLKKYQDPLEDDEYEIVEDDEYYNDIDV